MGGKQTKIECTDFTTPARPKPDDINMFDPRSPNFCRTPIEIASETSSNGRMDVLRKRFLKGFTYSINDPRSPSLNRTPLVLEDSNERSLNLDDTFADLFIGPSLPTSQVAVQNACDSVGISGEHQVQAIEKLPTTPVAVQQQFDPRSPSIGVDRTPIIFSDDENEASEDVVLENILSSLTLKMDESGSVVSIKAPEETKVRNESELVLKPSNKQLDRVRNGKKAVTKGQQKRQKQRLRQKIYEDSENHPSTPKLKVSNAGVTGLKNARRTPLSCVRNSSQLRSRSVDSPGKSNKTSNVIMSNDDALIPNERFRISNVM